MSAEAATAPATPEESFFVVSKDNHKFEISLEALQMSNMLKSLIQGVEDGNMKILPIQGVNENVLELVVKFCEHHKGGNELTQTDIHNPKNLKFDEWDEEFFDRMEDQVLFDLINACNFLDIKKLFVYACRRVSDMARGLSKEQMRERFGIKSNEEDAASEAAAVAAAQAAVDAIAK